MSKSSLSVKSGLTIPRQALTGFRLFHRSSSGLIRSVTDFLKHHPGGATVIAANAGRDVTYVALHESHQNRRIWNY
jgi:hypothetical protein